MFFIVALLVYLILPLSSLLIYRIELLQFYPDFIVSETITRSAVGVWLFYLFMFQLLLGSRPKYLEKSIGLDKLLRIHALTSISTLGLLFWHRSIREGAGNLTEATGTIVAILTISSVIVAVCFWHPTPFAKLPIISQIKKVLDKKITYDKYKKYHNVLGIAAIIVGLHINITNLAYDSFFTINILRLYFIICVSQYIWHKLIKPKKLRKELWELVHIEELVRADEKSRAVVCLSLKYIGRKQAMKYHSGQFGYIHFVNASPQLLNEEHPFSFSSHEDDDLIQITIQDEGDYTHAIQNECKIGDTLYIDGPYGTMSLSNITKKNKQTSISILAGGIGITPFIGWLKEASYNSDISLKLIWLQKNIDTKLVQKVLEYQIHKNISIHLFSRTNNREFTETEFLNLTDGKDIGSQMYCICASKLVTSYLADIVSKQGAKRSQIKTELFTLV